MTQPRVHDRDPDAEREEREERAASVGAMLGRWEAEDVSAEPDWDVADLEPLVLRGDPGDARLPPKP
jgi:hypothetical protein